MGKKMEKQMEQRDRTFILAAILQEDTDDKHPMSMNEMVDRLARQGVAAGRKSIYRDLAALRKHGMDVVFRPGGEGGWFVDQRVFSPSELRAVIDAVAVYRWLADDQRKTLVDKLVRLAPRPQRRSLRRAVAVRPRSAAQPDQLREALDRIHSALQRRRALSFLPVQYDRGKARAVAGPRRIISPKGLLWSGENYQLLAWDHRDRTMGIFRPDRMDQVLVAGMPAQGPEADAELWQTAAFGVDATRRERVRLRCCETLAGEVLDQFGAGAVLVPEGDHFQITADVTVGPRFWGWMSAHSDRAAVVAPPWAAKAWQDRYRLEGDLLGRRQEAG